MAKKIVIDFETSKAIRSLKKITAEIDSMKNRRMTMGFDFEGVKRWKSSNVDAHRVLMSNLDAENKKLKQLTSTMDMAAAAGKKIGRGFKSGIDAAKDNIAGLERELKRLERTAGSANFIQRLGARMQYKAAKGGNQGGMMDTVGGALGGVGDAIGMMGPVGMGLGVGLAAYAGARAISAPRRNLANRNLEFMGLSTGARSPAELFAMRNSGTGYGFGGTEQMQSATMLQRSAGNVSAGDLTEFGRLRRRTGMGADELGGITGSFRAAATTSAGASLSENLKKTEELYRRGLVSALDSSGVIRYLQITSSMTEQIAEEGAVDADAIAKTITSLTQGSEFYRANAGRAAAAMQGGEGFFRSQQGTGLALRAMQSSGMGGSPLEMLFKQQLGFSEKGGIGAKGLSGIVKEISGASSGLTTGNFGKASNNQKAGAYLSVQQALGISASNAKELVDTIMGGKKLSQAKIGELTATEADKNANLLKSIDMQIAKNEASFENVILALGDRIIPYLASLEGSVLRIANKIVGVSDAQTITDTRATAKNLAATNPTMTESIMGMVGLGKDRKVSDLYTQSGRAAIKSGGDLIPEEGDALFETLGRKGNITGASALASKTSGQIRGQYNELDIKDAMKGYSAVRGELEKNISSREAQDPSRTDLGEERALLARFDAMIDKLNRALSNKQDRPIVQPMKSR